MDKPPIFIIGYYRSGTTLLRVILDSHPNIGCGPETYLIGKLYSFNESLNENFEILKSYSLERGDLLIILAGIVSSFFENYVKLKNKKRWAEKTPDNIFYVDFIDKLFPTCQFINIIRDGRDVICSVKERWGRLTIFPAIKKWNKSIDLTFKYREKLSKDRYLEIRYEELVIHPEKETKKIMEFLQEEWMPVLLEYYKLKHDYWFQIENGEDIDLRIEKHPNRHTPSQPIFINSVGKWKKKLNLFEKTLVNISLKKNLEKLGYK